MAEPVKIGNQTFVYTQDGWVDSKTKAKAPEGLTTLLNNISKENSVEGKKARVILDPRAPPVKFGNTEYAWDMNGQTWVDRKTKIAVNSNFNKMIQQVAGYTDSLYNNQIARQVGAQTIIKSTGIAGQAAQQKTAETPTKVSGSGTLPAVVPVGKINITLVKMIDQLVILDGYLNQNLKNRIIKDRNEKLAARELEIESDEKQSEFISQDAKRVSATGIGLGLLGIGAFLALEEQISSIVKPLVDGIKGVRVLFENTVNTVTSVINFFVGSDDSDSTQTETKRRERKPIEYKPPTGGGRGREGPSRKPIEYKPPTGGGRGKQTGVRKPSPTPNTSSPKKKAVAATPAPSAASSKKKARPATDTIDGYINPVEGYSINSAYGMRVHPKTGVNTFHTGVDIAAPEGTPIRAVKSGKVIKAEFAAKGSGYGGYGNVVIIDHGDGYQSVYAHLSKFACKVGQQVSQGQIIGYVGNTGTSTGAHLHFIVQKTGISKPTKGNTIDPAPLLRKGGVTIPAAAAEAEPASPAGVVAEGGNRNLSATTEKQAEPEGSESLIRTLGKYIGDFGAVLVGPGTLRNINSALQDTGAEISEAQIAKNAAIAASKAEKAQDNIVPSPPNINMSADSATVENPATVSDRSGVFYYLTRFGYQDLSTPVDALK